MNAIDIKTTRTVTLGDFTVTLGPDNTPEGFTYLGAPWVPMPQDRELIDQCLKALMELHDAPGLTEADIVDTYKAYKDDIDKASHKSLTKRWTGTFLIGGAIDLRTRLVQRLRGKAQP